MGKGIKSNVTTISKDEANDLLSDSTPQAVTTISKDEADDLLSDDTTPQKKSPDGSAAPSVNSSTPLQSGATTNNEPDFHTDPLTGLPLTTPVNKTQAATDFIAKDYLTNIGAPEGIDVSNPQHPVNQVTDPHGDPAYLSNYVKGRIASIEQKRQQEQSDITLHGAPDNPLDPYPAQQAINQKYDQEKQALLSNAGQVMSLQLFNKEVNQKKYDQEDATRRMALLQQQQKDEQKVIDAQIAETNKWAHPNGVAAMEERSRLQAKQKDIQNHYAQQMQAVRENTKYNPIMIGAEYAANLGDPQAAADLDALKQGRLINPASQLKYNYQGNQVIQQGADATINEKAKQEGEQNADRDNSQLFENNKPYLVQQGAQAIGNAKYNDENPLMKAVRTVVPSQVLPGASRKEIEDYGKDLGLDDKVIDELKKDPSQIPKQASIPQQFLRGAFNAPAPIYEQGVRLAGHVLGGDQEAINENFAPGWEQQRGLGAAIAGNMPTDQNSFSNFRGALGQIFEGAGNLATFAGEVGGVSKGLEGLGVTANTAEKIANFGVMSLQGYNDAYKNSLDVIGDKPEDEGKRQLYSLINGLATGALFSISPKTQLIKNALGVETKTGQQLLKEIQSNGGTEFLQTAEGKALGAKYIQEFGKELGTQVTLATGQKIFEDITNTIVNPEKKQDIGEDIKNTAISTALTMLLPSLGGAFGHVNEQTPLNNAAMFEVGSHPDQYIGEIAQQLQDGKITPQQAQISHDAILGMKSAITNTPTTSPEGNPLSPDQIKAYSYNLFQEQLLNKQIKSLEDGANLTQTPVDKAQVDPLKKKIAELQKKRSDILANPAPPIIAPTPERSPDNYRDKDDQPEEEASATKNSPEKLAQTEENNIPLTSTETSQQKEAENEKHDERNGEQNNGQISPNAEEHGQENPNPAEAANSEAGVESGQDRELTPEEENKAQATPSEQPIPVSGRKRKKVAAVEQYADEIPLTVTPELQTRDDGKAKGKPEAETEDKLHEAMLTAPEKPVDHLLTDKATGETPDHFVERIGSTIHDFTKPEDKGGLKDNTLLVTHSNVIKLLLSAYDKTKKEFDFNKPDLLEKVADQSTEVGNLYQFKIKDKDGNERTIHVARHGETESNLEDLQRKDDDQLTQAGKDDAVDVARQLKEKGIAPPQILSSDLPRAKETADIIQKELSAENKKQTTFKTSKGSEYILHEDGTTTRNKAARNEPGHEGQQGIQPRSQKTYFVTPEDAQKLTIFQTKGWEERGETPVIGETKEGKLAVGIRGGKNNGLSIKGTDVKYKSAPEKGLLPVEIWSDGTQAHFGNEITEINQGTEPSTERRNEVKPEPQAPANKEKPKQNASPQSKKQQQEGNKQSGQPEHARAQQAGSEAKAAETKRGDSDIGGEKKKALSSKAQSLLDHQIGQYKSKDKAPVQQQKMIDAANRRIENFKNKKRGKPGYDDALAQNNADRAFLEHAAQNPPKFVNRGETDFTTYNANKRFVEQSGFEPQTAEDHILLHMAQGGKFRKGTDEVTGIEKHLPTKNSSSEYKSTEDKWLVPHDTGKEVYDKALKKNVPVADADKLLYNAGIDDPQNEANAAEVISSHNTQGEVYQRLADIIRERKQAEESPSEKSITIRYNGHDVEFNPKSPTLESDIAKLMGEPEGDHPVAFTDEGHPIFQEGLKGEEAVDNASMTDEENDLLDKLIDKHTSEDGKLNIDAFADDLAANRDKFGKDVQDIIGKFVPFPDIGEHEVYVKELLQKKQDYERTNNSQRANESTSAGRSEKNGAEDGHPGETQGDSESTQSAGNEGTEIKDLPNQAQPLNGANAENPQSEKEVSATQKRLNEIEEDLTKQKDSQKLESQLRDKAEKEKNIDQANKHNTNFYKKQEKIDKLNQEKAALQRDQEIEKRYNDLADKFDAQAARNKENLKGAKRSGLFPHLSEEISDFINGRISDGIRELGNLHVAIQRAFRLAKEKFGKEVDSLDEKYIKKAQEYYKDFDKAPDVEPKLPVDQEDYAKEILADIENKNDPYSYEDAEKEVAEKVFNNRDDQPMSEAVQEKNKARILQYIKYHTTPEPEMPKYIADMDEPVSIKNAYTRALRAKLGLGEEIPAGREKHKDVVEEAKQQIEKDPSKPQRLVDELAKNPRAPTNVETAILTHHLATLRNNIKDLFDKINDAGEQGRKADVFEHQGELAAIQDQFQKAVDVYKKVGSESGRSLAARNIALDSRYELADMLAEKQAVANDGQPLTPDQTAEIKKLYDKIKETQDAADEYQKQKEKEYNEKITELQRQLLAARQEKGTKEAAASSTSGKSSAKLSNLEKIQLKSKTVADRLFKWADDFDEKNKGNTYSTIVPITPKMVSDAVRLVATGIEKGGELLDQIQKAIREISSSNPDIDVVHLEREVNQAIIDAGVVPPSKENTEKTKAIQLMTGFFTNGKLDPEAVRRNVAANRAKNEFDTQIKKDEAAKRSKSARYQDTFVKWEREFLLSNPLVLAKLTAAAGVRLMAEFAEEPIGALYTKLFPRLGRGAMGEGNAAGLHVREYTKDMVRGLMLGMKDAATIMSKGSEGKSDLDVLFGKGGDLPPEAMTFFGRLHSAFKAPIKRAVFETKLYKRLRNYKANGVDASDPMVQTRAMNEAYIDANRAIFMQDNKVADWYQKQIKGWEQGTVNKETGEIETPDKWKASTLKYLVPFVKVPSNIIAESAKYAYGLLYGSLQAGKAYHSDAVDNLTSDQRDIIFRNLKKGTIGNAALLLGFFASNNFGGYYQSEADEKKKKAHGQPPSMGIETPFGQLPRWALEHPLIQAMQIGATVNRVWHSKVKGEEKGLPSGLLAAALGLTEEQPLVGNALRIGNLIRSHGSANEFNAYVGEQAKSTAVPAIINYAAMATDPADKGTFWHHAFNPQNVRKPKSVLERVESGIPGLREKLKKK
jgi:broad specificity phosphatase PhoE